MLQRGRSKQPPEAFLFTACFFYLQFQKGKRKGPWWTRHGEESVLAKRGERRRRLHAHVRVPRLGARQKDTSWVGWPEEVRWAGWHRSRQPVSSPVRGYAKAPFTLQRNAVAHTWRAMSLLLRGRYIPLHHSAEDARPPALPLWSKKMVPENHEGRCACEGGLPMGFQGPGVFSSCRCHTSWRTESSAGACTSSWWRRVCRWPHRKLPRVRPGGSPGLHWPRPGPHRHRELPGSGKCRLALCPAEKGDGPRQHLLFPCHKRETPFLLL